MLTNGSIKQANFVLFAKVDLENGEKGVIFKGEIMKKTAFNKKVKNKLIKTDINH